MKFQAALGRDRDVAITAHETIINAAATAFESVLWVAPDITRAYAPLLVRGNTSGIALSSLPRNELAIRSVQVASEAAVAAGGVNSAELRLHLWRNGVLQGALANYNLIASTTITPAITAGTAAQTVAVASGATLRVGQSVLVDTAAAQETVVLTAVTATTVTALFTKNHAGGVALAAGLGAFNPALLAPAWHGVAAGATLPAITAGAGVVFTPNAVNGNSGMLGIHVGDKLLVSDAGLTETVTVTAVTTTQATATFANSHAINTPISTAALGLNAGVSGTELALAGNDTLTLAKIIAGTGVIVTNPSVTIDFSLAVAPLGA